MTDENFIRAQVRKVLGEAEEASPPTRPATSSPTPTSSVKPAAASTTATAGSVIAGRKGSGRWMPSINDASALANSAPEKLMSKLKIKTVTGSTTVEKIFSVMQQAVRTLRSTEGLEDAYDSIAAMKTPEGTVYIRITPGEISERDAAAYMLHTLTGAQNAGILTGLDKMVVPELDNGRAVVNFRDMK